MEEANSNAACFVVYNKLAPGQLGQELAPALNHLDHSLTHMQVSI
jgi:hypothetical protein